MSDAVDNAELMLICVSLAYKESASELRKVACLLRNDSQQVPRLVQTAVSRPTTVTSRRLT